MNKKEQLWMYMSLFQLLCIMFGYALELSSWDEANNSFTKIREQHSKFIEKMENE